MPLKQFLLIIKHLLFQMRSLKTFAEDRYGPLFPDATSLPTFFDNNLVDSARVVKIFKNDPQANIRIFYYQYLKLCFELENVNFEDYISKIEQIINNEDFKFIFYEDDDPEIYSDLQFKSLITEFFGILGQGQITVEDCLNRYPIMDTVFIYFFRAILILTGKTDTLDSYIDREDLLNFLCNYFAVEISIHDKCIKFVETDIFIYQEDPKEVFMAYMDYDKNNELPPREFEEPSQQEEIMPDMIIPSEEQKQPALVANTSHRQNTQTNKSYISSDFLDYTQVNSTNLNGLVQPSKMRTSATLEKPEQEQNIFMSSNIEQAKKYQESTLPLYSDTKKKSELPKIQYESPQVQLGTLSYSSQSNNQSYGLGSLSDKSGPLQTQIPSYQHNFNKNHGKVDDLSYKNLEKWEPSKDPISSNNLIKQENISILPSQKPPSNLGYQSSYIPSSYQPPSTGDSYRTKQSSYTSNASDSYKYIQTKPLTPDRPKQFPVIPSYQSTYSVASSELPLATGKNPFNINVSLQFTNSITMKAMAEPYKGNVRSIRQKARTYRDSLKSYIK